MNKSLEIKHLTNSKIDYKKWDLCINDATNKNLYAQSWYLNIVSPNWEAFVFGNYEFVMPLTIKTKFGFKYLSQPYFAQQLGIFPSPSKEIQKYFANTLAQKFRFINYQINWQMDEMCFSSFSSFKRTNLILKLADYNTIYKNYKENTRRNIKKANTNKIRVMQISTETYLNNFESKYPVPKSALLQLERIMYYAIHNGQGEILGAYSTNNILCAAAFFLRAGNRIIYLNAFSTDLGRENRSMYAIIDKYILENENSDYILDFEGSNKEGLAKFYKGFGAKVENYYHIYLNRLPFIFKVLKKI